MPRHPRQKSSNGVYHIMVRGINRHDIFIDNADREKYIGTLIKYIPVCGYEIYGYCLMSNHVHLLLREGIETISQVMKRIGASYVYWYNLKYERIGPLFQDRFRSETVEDDKQLLVTLRYIHQNPLKAGIVDKIEHYQWSSYREYIDQNSILTKAGFVIDIFDSERDKAIEAFKNFMERENEDKCLENEVRIRMHISDEHAKSLIKQLTRSDNPQILQQMGKKERDEIIRLLKNKNISIRKIARLTGIGKRIIEKA